MARIKVDAYQCDRCGYIWFPRKRTGDEGEPSPPKTCPHCKSPYWDTPRKNRHPANGRPSLGEDTVSESNE